MESIRKSTSPTCSPGSSISGPTPASMNSCLGPGQPRTQPTNPRPDPGGQSQASDPCGQEEAYSRSHTETVGATDADPLGPAAISTHRDAFAKSSLTE